MLKIVTGRYISIAPAAVVCCDEPGFLLTHAYSRTVRITEYFATVTRFRIICSKVKIQKDKLLLHLFYLLFLFCRVRCAV